MNPAHLHLMLNHIPVLGTAFGLGLLVFAIWRKGASIRRPPHQLVNRRVMMLSIKPHPPRQNTSLTAPAFSVTPSISRPSRDYQQETPS